MIKKTLDYHESLKDKDFRRTVAPFLAEERPLAPEKGWLLLIGAPILGSDAEPDLGEALMLEFLSALAENTPETVIFYHAGVKLACENSAVLAAVYALEQAGVEVLCCRSSLEYYQLKRSLCVGKAVSMAKISERLAAAFKVVTL